MTLSYRCVLLFTIIALSIKCFASSGDPHNDEIPPLFYANELNATKTLMVRLLFKTESDVEKVSVTVVDGPPRTLKGSPRQLRLEYVERENATKRFYAPYPFYRRSWVQARPTSEFDDGTGIRHSTVKMHNSSARIPLPFSADAEILRVYDEKNGALLITVDLAAPVRTFCKNQPDFDRCDKHIMSNELVWAICCFK